MIQPQTQTETYWVNDFALSDADIEHIYNHLLEVEVPRTTAEITQVIIKHRVAEERNKVQRRLAGRTVYQPQDDYDQGAELVFPALKFAKGTVVSKRDGNNPQYGTFGVIGVDVDGKTMEFASGLAGEHELNLADGESFDPIGDVDPEQLYAQFGAQVAEKIGQELDSRAEFVSLGGRWFVKALMAEVDTGHLHLAEAVLEMHEGGPLPTAEILTHLDMDATLKPEVTRFSLDHALLQDDRFDEVAPTNRVAWFLRRLEPEGVRDMPERLQYREVSYDRALLNSSLRLLEAELDDEWSNKTTAIAHDNAVLSLTYPHRWSGTLPFSARVRPLFPVGRSPRQRFTLIDEHTAERMPVWVVQEGRYIYGLGDWYESNGIPIGGYINLKSGPEPDILFIGYDRRRAQREWVRLASVVDGRIKFELKRRAVASGYDDLLIVGTDFVAAVDALWRQADARQRSIASLLAEIFPELAQLTPQNSVHAKTLYSAINLLRRLPPGPIFAELVRHPAFQPVGDHYWQFNSNRWQSDR